MADLGGVRHRAGVEYKRNSVAYLWWILLGPFGAHRFYLGHIATGVLYACTFGLLLLGWLMDLFMIPSYVKAWNHRVDSQRRMAPEGGFEAGLGV